MFGLILLAISVSMDALGMGFSYGLRKIQIPLLSKILLGLVSFGCSMLAILFGLLLRRFLPQPVNLILNIAILFGLGVYILISGIRETANPNEKQNKPPSSPIVWNLLNCTVTIVHHPTVADRDGNRIIEPVEAVLLGFAVSLDAFSAGLGVSLSGSSVGIFPVMIGLSHFLFLVFGEQIGKRLKHKLPHGESLLGLLPGLILIILSLLKLTELF